MRIHRLHYDSKVECYWKLLRLWTGGHVAFGNETRRFGNWNVPVLLGPVADNIPTELVPRHPTTFGQRHPLLKMSCFLLSARRSIKPREQVMTVQYHCQNIMEFML
jgi:hypothetical protein